MNLAAIVTQDGLSIVKLPEAGRIFFKRTMMKPGLLRLSSCITGT